MISMQYRFVLPADYDMQIIRQRISDKGHLLDNFPGLMFKAYLFADTLNAESPAPFKLYAPFYLWENTLGMKRFLCSSGFEGVQRSFGRPQLMSWIPLAQTVLPSVRQARYASRALVKLKPLASLETLEAEEEKYVQAQITRNNALACISALDPHNWTLMRFSLYAQSNPLVDGVDIEFYQVGYVAGPS
ncbi:DUF4865 domain-containing protein [Marinobacterium zhoushanense]|uniref:DUF4865 domain-containing protein n=1 Tax=Marinobacterium zhoushanense TaxID=1679163 RepID=A0ABQ1KMS9_9GAMM|nr:DUF4865 family protein [Marinobacterium zhoushanense]GGC00731.1 DUF4865 domain-containing protein [Marinobacterium zhoushanense]